MEMTKEQLEGTGKGLVSTCLKCYTQWWKSHAAEVHECPPSTAQGTTTQPPH